MSTEQMRKEFELHMFRQNICTRLKRSKIDGHYLTATVQRAWELWQAALATQPQAPQGAVTDAERYEFLCSCDDSVTVDFLAECLGDREQLSALIDELIKEQKSAAPKTETPEGDKQ